MHTAQCTDGGFPLRLKLSWPHRKIRLIEDNAKCLIHVFSYLIILIQTGKGRRGERGGIEPERRLEGQQFTAGSKIPIRVNFF